MLADPLLYLPGRLMEASVFPVFLEDICVIKLSTHFLS